MGNTIIVNYHYIRDESTNGIRGCSVNLFKSQLDFLNENYEIVPLSEVYKVAQENNSRRLCALTFDDGLKEHYEVAFKLLKEKGVTGSFFVIGAPLVEKTVPVTHKLHLLLSLKTTEEMVELFHSFFKGRYMIAREVRINPKRRFDDILTSNLKETLIALPIVEKEVFINGVFTDAYKDEAKISRNIFMTTDNIKEMHTNGMEIGSHTYSHRALDVMSGREQEVDLKRGIDLIRSITGKGVITLSYPHGRYSPDTFGILEKLGVSFAVVLGGRSVTSQDHKFAIPRYDTNDLKL